MSELVIDHPITVIENLLKLHRGDEGRLLYIRKALINGKTIYESDKKYLKKMQEELTQIPNQNFKNPMISDGKRNIGSDAGISNSGKSSESFEIEIRNIQNSIEDLKKRDSKIKDNLEFLLLNREIELQRALDKTNSFGKFSNLPKNTSSDLFDLIAKNPVLEKSRLFKIKKSTLMAYVSAGLFSLWYASHQHFVDLGIFQNWSMGFSAGAAVSACLFYRNEKIKNLANSR